MSDKFLSAENPKSDTDNGWIEYALLLGWEELPVGYEYVTDNATTELATLRAQLAVARELISEAKIEVGFAIHGNTQPSISTYEKLTAYLQKVKSA